MLPLQRTAGPVPNADAPLQGTISGTFNALLFTHEYLVTLAAHKRLKAVASNVRIVQILIFANHATKVAVTTTPTHTSTSPQLEGQGLTTSSTSPLFRPQRYLPSSILASLVTPMGLSPFQPADSSPGL